MFTKVFTFAFAFTGLALLFACSAQPVVEEHVGGNKTPEFAKALPEGCKLGPVAHVDGAEIYALLDPSAPSSTDFVTLDEAMAQKLCTVRETEGGGSVNTLKISNSGAKPIFCMAGDLVLGGQQDRILAESLVVAPATQDQDIPVFCVEHGRWQTQDKDGAAAKDGCFDNSAERGQVDLNVKKAALESRNQSAVWHEVARNNGKLAVTGQTESGTFRATFDDKTTCEKIEKGFATAQKLVGKGVVGFAVVCNDELVAMDVFESTELCAKLSNKLLRSYVITGIGGGYESNVSATGTASPQNRTMTLQLSGESEQREVQTGQDNNAEGQFDNNASGIAPANPSSGIFFTNNVANTETKREYTKESVKYDCTDKKSGKVVQRSFLKR